jgi:hypothetical protein
MLALLTLVVSLQLAQLPPGLEASGPPLQRGALLYVPLVGGGVAVVDVSVEGAPKVVASVLEGRFITRLLLDGDRLIALEAKEEALVLTLEDPQRPKLARGALAPAAPVALTPTPAATPAVTLPPPGAFGTVIEVTRGRVIFEGGTDKGFRQGVRVKVLSQRKVPKPDLVTGAMVDVPSGEVTAVLAIEQADANRAMAVLGRGDTAEKGDRVEVTTEPVSERLFFPRRAPFEWRFGFVVRPFLGLEGTTKPVGVMLDAYVAWYPASIPLSVSVMATPFAFSINGREPHSPGTFLAMGGYATDFFEIALGAGALTGNIGPCVQMDPLSPTVCEVNTGFTINSTCGWARSTASTCRGTRRSSRGRRSSSSGWGGARCRFPSRAGSASSRAGAAARTAGPSASWACARRWAAPAAAAP